MHCPAFRINSSDVFNFNRGFGYDFDQFVAQGRAACGWVLDLVHVDQQLIFVSGLPLEAFDLVIKKLPFSIGCFFDLVAFHRPFAFTRDFLWSNVEGLLFGCGGWFFRHAAILEAHFTSILHNHEHQLAIG